MKQLRLLIPVNGNCFDEAGYLRANPDVARAVADGLFASGQSHFATFGRNENRCLRKSIPSHWKAEKLARLQPLMRDEVRTLTSPDRIDCLSDDLREEFRIVPTDNVSSHDYDQRALSLIQRHSDGLLLDCGAGLRSTYYSNIVNCEIVAYDSTDVLAAAERLPFRDGSFDAVMSMNVLEHVKNPFLAAQELVRVLKPGGEIMCVAPFLQPLHGYPHHYYNMTSEGLLNLFESLIDKRTEIYGTMQPIWALQWFLSSYHAGLPDQQRERFATMTVSELLASPEVLQNDPVATTLDPNVSTMLASAHALFGRKRESS